jgi:hypothetical protein
MHGVRGTEHGAAVVGESCDGEEDSGLTARLDVARLENLVLAFWRKGTDRSGDLAAADSAAGDHTSGMHSSGTS